MNSLEGNVVHLEVKVCDSVSLWQVCVLTLPPLLQFVSGQNLSPGRQEMESFKVWVALSGTEHDSTCNLESFRKLNSDTTPLVSERR